MAKKLIRKLLRRAKPAATDPVPASVPGQLPLDTAGPERPPELRMESGETAPIRERTLAEYLGDAVELRDAGRFDEADALLAEAIERFPEEPRPRFEWALLPHFRLDWAEAARRSELVREQFPDAAATHALGAIVLRELGRYDDAERLLAAARERFPEDLRIAAECAWLATHKQNWAEALRRWGTVRKNFPDWPGGYTGTAMIYRELTWFDEAEVTLEDAAERFPADPDLFVEYARFEQARGNASAAAERWQAVRDRFPNERAGYEDGAAVLRELGRDEEAEALVVEAAERFSTHAESVAGKVDTALAGQDASPGASVQSAVSDKPVASGETSTSADTPSTVSTRRLETGALTIDTQGELRRLEEQARAAADAHDWPKALSFWSRLREALPDYLGGYAGAITALRRLGRLDEAEGIATEAIKRFPAESGPLIEFAWIAHDRQDWSVGVSRWEAARRVFPDEAWGYVGGALASFFSGENDRADAILQDALARFPKNRGVLAGWAEAAERRGDWPEAARRWEHARRHMPDDPLTFFRGARALLAGEDPEGAEALLADAAQRFSDNREITIALAEAAARRRDWLTAADRWDRVLQISLNETIAYLGLAAALRQLERAEDAELVLSAAVERFPDDRRPAIEYAWLAHNRGDWEEALRRWGAVRARFPHEAWGHHGGGRALLSLGRIGEAEALLTAAEERFPGDQGIARLRAECAALRQEAMATETTGQ